MKPKNKLDEQIRNLPNKVGEYIVYFEPQILDKVSGRWKIGKSVDGGLIGEYRNDDYRAYKLAINPQARGNVDLILTGSLMDHLLIRKIGKEEFIIESTDEKFEKLSNKYGLWEFGLNDEEWSEFYNEIYVFVIEDILNETYQNI